MKMESHGVNENGLLLFDRLEAIKTTITKYGESNFYISFSGGKDSTVVHHLVDMALPGNTIPRVYMNTGIEYNAILNFVKELAVNDNRFVILNSTTNIKDVLEKYGYPFKSKDHSKRQYIYRSIGMKSKAVQAYLNNPDPRKKRFQCPKMLKFQFSDDYPLKLSDKCCVYIKEAPLKKYQKQAKKKWKILGLMKEEGNRRTKVRCISLSKGSTFSPLAVVSKEWEDWFIEKYNIQLCKLYYPPFNFARTGCKGCPFAIKLQEQLDILEKFFPNERKQCEILWKPVYDEYRRLGYRLKRKEEK